MGILKTIVDRVALFCRNSTLHGLKYIGNASCSTGQRIFWILSFLTASGIGIFLIRNLFDKYNNNQVIITLNAWSISANLVPFPAVTVCSMNRVNKEKAHMILANGTEKEKLLIKDICRFNESKQTNLPAWNNEELINLLIKVSPTCQQMIKECRWNLEQIDCNSIFSRVQTDLGTCYSFNLLPLKYILRKPLEINATDTNFSLFQDWNFENGYKNDNSRPYPRKLLGAGLSLVFDFEVQDYYCSSSNSVGFMLDLTNPTDIPKLKYYGFAVSPGVETNVIIKPAVIDAKPDLRDVLVDKRKCYFNGERYLRLYRTYTRNNCLMDCEANYTMNWCNCIPYYLMNNSTTRVCDTQHRHCITDVLEMVASNEKPPYGKTNCKCFPSCFDLMYNKQLNYGKLIDTIKLKYMYSRNISKRYFKENVGVVNIYFPFTYFSRMSKSEIYGATELMSNIGGLLGIVFGFSFLSAAEIMYYLVCYLIPAFFIKVYRNLKSNIMLYPFTK